MKNIKRFKDNSRYPTWLMPVLLGTLLTACGGDGGRDPILGIDNMVGNAPVAPTVTNVVPQNNDFDIAFNNTVINATFSEAMLPITGDASFIIECFAPCVNPTGSVTLDMTNTLATYTLDAPLSPLTAYIVTITGAESIAEGVALEEPYVWHFTTGAAGDTTQPTVTMTFPETTLPLPTPTIDVPANAAITAVFSEDMVETSITAPGTFTLTCELPCVSPVDGVVTYSSGSKTATFTPTLDLDVATTYTATISATVTDTALNGLAGNQLPIPPAASAYIWTFTTVAALPPQNIDVDDLTIVPDANAVGVCPTRAIEATFIVPSLLRMSDATVNSSTFTVTGPGPLFLPVTAASVVLDSDTGITATFTPYEPLSDGVNYIVTIKGGASGVKDTAIIGNEMLADYTWEFTAGPPTGECLPAVDMGLASTFGIATTSGVTNTPTAPITTINGNVVMISTETCNAAPVDQAGGFGTCVTPDRVPVINGIVITSIFPDAFTALAVKADLNEAFLSITATDGVPAAGSMNNATPIAAPTSMGAVTGSALVEGQNLFYPGVYRSITSIMISGDLTLDAKGDAHAVFVFQSDSSTGTAAGAPGLFTRILLVNGAQASNVWWQVGSSATLGLYSEFNGNILAAFDITMETGATSCGRLMSGAWVGGSGALVFDSNIVSVPGNNCPVR